MSAGDLLGGGTEMVRMWDDLAKVSPDDIVTDVEAISDVNQQQLDSAKDMVDKPLSALASNVFSGMTILGSYERVDAYIREHCDGRDT